MLRSIEDSLQRLGLDRLDIVFVHDLSPDNVFLPKDWETLWPVAERGAFPALTRLREEGVIDAWGMGVNCPQPILRYLETADSGLHLLASQCSLVDHADDAVEQGFPKARQKASAWWSARRSTPFGVSSAREGCSIRTPPFPLDCRHEHRRLRRGRTGQAAPAFPPVIAKTGKQSAGALRWERLAAVGCAWGRPQGTGYSARP